MSAPGCFQALSPRRAGWSSDHGPRLSSQWLRPQSTTGWHGSRPKRPPQVVNTLRLGHVLERIARRFGRPLASIRNRTLHSCQAAIVGAERVLRVLPRGVQRWAQFVRPGELEQAAAACGLSLNERHGMAYPPAAHRAWSTRNQSVHHIASFDEPVT